MALLRSGDQQDGSYAGVWVVIGGMGVDEAPEGESAEG